MKKDGLPKKIVIHDYYSKNVFFINTLVGYQLFIGLHDQRSKHYQISTYLRWSASNPDYWLFEVLSHTNQSILLGSFGVAKKQNEPYPSANQALRCCFQKDGIFVNGWEGVKDCWLKLVFWKATRRSKVYFSAIEPLCSGSWSLLWGIYLKQIEGRRCGHLARRNNFS